MTDRPAETKAQLGCGTLIIIAIIVMIFSGGRDSSRLKDDVRQLNRKIDRLESKIDDLTKRLEQNSVPSSNAVGEAAPVASPEP
jgi:outer membrane murein-binding lipoprotein Lpp